MRCHANATLWRTIHPCLGLREPARLSDARAHRVHTEMRLLVRGREDRRQTRGCRFEDVALNILDCVLELARAQSVHLCDYRLQRPPEPARGLAVCVEGLEHEPVCVVQPVRCMEEDEDAAESAEQASV